MVKKQSIEDSCIICSEQKREGIYLYTSFICTECEREIVQTETNEPGYKYYVEKLKAVNKPKICS